MGSHDWLGGFNPFLPVASGRGSRAASSSFNAQGQQYFDVGRQAQAQAPYLQVAQDRLNAMARYPTNAGAVDPSDPWYKRLKELEQNHRGRIRLTPEGQLRAMFDDLRPWCDDAVVQAADMARAIDESVMQEMARSHKAGRDRHYRRQRILTKWFKVKLTLFGCVTGESNYTIIRDMLRAD